MDKKILLAVVFIVAVIAMGIGLFSLGFFGQTTQVDTKFLSGIIQGEAVDTSYMPMPVKEYTVNYEDNKNNITYEFMMADTLQVTIKLIETLGGGKITTKEYNGVKWDIYYSRGGYSCIASGKNGDYCVHVNGFNVSHDRTLNSDLFKNYVEPLLNSITLKDSNPPKEYEVCGIPIDEYNNFMQNH